MRKFLQLTITALLSALLVFVVAANAGPSPLGVGIGITWSADFSGNGSAGSPIEMSTLVSMPGRATIAGSSSGNSLQVIASDGWWGVRSDTTDNAALVGRRFLTANTTDDTAAVYGQNTGTMTTATNIYNYGVRGLTTVTKSSGVGNLHDYGVFGRAGTENGTANVAYETIGVMGGGWEGSGYSVGGSFRSGTANGVSMAGYHQSDNSGAGISVGSYDYSRSGAVRVGTAAIAATGAATATIGLYASNSAYTESFPAGSFALYADGASTINGALSMATHYITNVVDPVNPQDAATKAYVDGLAGGGFTGSGTANYLPVFTGATALGNSTVSQDTTSFPGFTTVTIGPGVLGVTPGYFACTGATASGTAWDCYLDGDFRSAGNAIITGQVESTGSLFVNTNRFTVNGTSGNTAVLGDFAVNTTKFTVDDSTGDTHVDGALGVAGVLNGAAANFTGTTTVLSIGNSSGTAGISSCGSGASVNGGMSFGRFTMGSSGTICTITFGGTWSATPSCVIYPESGGSNPSTTARSTSGFTIGLGVANGVYTYHCGGY